MKRKGIGYETRKVNTERSGIRIAGAAPAPLLALVLLLLPTLAVAQQTTLRSTAQEVLLDLIIRGKQQKMVSDLKAEDVEIYEDGVRQSVRSFRFVEGKRPEGEAGSATPARTSADAAFDPLRELNLVTLVFQAMGPNERRLATQVVNEFLDNQFYSNTYASVFTLNNRLALVQPFTNDINLVRKGVSVAGTGAYLEIAKKSIEEVARLQTIHPGAETMGPPADADVSNFQPVRAGSAEERISGVDVAINTAMMRLHAAEIAMVLHQQGSMNIDGLRTLIREQAVLPGRKTVLYLTTGLVTPPGQPELLRSVVSEANRANVTFYGVDCTGLDTASPARISEAVNAALNKNVDNVIEHTNFQENLSELSDGTGGFAMANSNDLRAPLRRVMEEVRSHYELTYVPLSDKYDGRFRKIEVKVARSGIRVQTRRGYFALPVFKGRSVAPVEMALLAALDANPRPQALPYRAALLQFRAGNETECRAVFELPAARLQFARDEKTRTFQIHAAFLALIKNQEGLVVEKVSRDLPFSAPLDRAAEFQKGNVTVSLPLSLPTGRYTLETAVLDRLAGTAGTRRSSANIPQPVRLGISDLILARRIEDTRDPDPGDPLQFAQKRVTPQLGNSLAAGSEVPLYAVLYPDPRNAAKPRVLIEVRLEGKVIAQSEPGLAPPDAFGAIPITVLIPAGAKGSYDLTVVAEQGSERASRLFSFVVE